MFANVTLVAYTIAAVTLFTAGSTMAVTICPFEGLFAEEFLGSFFATLVLFAPSIALLGVISPFAIRVLM